MEWAKIKNGMLVEDKWYWDWGYGKVILKLKTVVRIYFSGMGTVVFDRSHVQFLEEVTK